MKTDSKKGEVLNAILNTDTDVSGKPKQVAARDLTGRATGTDAQAAALVARSPFLKPEASPTLEGAPALPETQTVRVQNESGVTVAEFKRVESALALRVRALYHNCLSSACFAREDALKADDEGEAQSLRRSADAFEQVAGWLNAARA